MIERSCTRRATAVRSDAERSSAASLEPHQSAPLERHQTASHGPHTSPSRRPHQSSYGPHMSASRGPDESALRAPAEAAPGLRRKLARLTTRACALGALALSISAPASTQEQAELTVQESQAVVNQRLRAEIHPGEPLNVVGLEQGDNNFRAATPALENNDGMVALVDRDELRRRRLALYAGATMTHPLPTTLRPREEVSPNPNFGRPANAIPVQASDDGIDHVWWILPLIALGLVGITVYRNRDAYRRTWNS